jgi:hypothetical protein
MYAEGLPPEVRLKALTHDGRLPFVFEASGAETHFTNGFDPVPRARRIFAVPRPETLARAIRDAEAEPDAQTWLARVARMPPLITDGLRPAQIDAIRGVEHSLAATCSRSSTTTPVPRRPLPSNRRAPVRGSARTPSSTARRRGSRVGLG